MITKAILLFLLGTAMASELFMKKLQYPYEVAEVPSYKSSGCPTAADWAPLICKFLQTNTDLYYKPQLIAPSTYIPPLVVQKCETPEIKVNLELPAQIEEKKPISIPQPPELPPLTIPKFPVPVIVEELPKKINKPSSSPEMPLINIPAAPQLPELEMPVISQIFEQPEPYFFNEAIPEIDNNDIDEKPTVIPQPPELPEFKLSEFPKNVEIPSGSVLPVMDIPAPHLMAEKPCDEPSLNEKGTPEIDHNLVKFEPISIPQPPELSDFVMPELPAIPTDFENKPIAYSPIQAEFKPLAILPAAPELPPAKLPEFPVSVEIPSGPILSPGDLSQPIMVVEQPNEEPCLKEETPNFDSEYKHVFPQPPELPPFDMPELSTLSFEQEPIKTYYEPLAPLPAAPELPAANLPEFPVNVEISAAPALPAIYIPSPTMAEEQPLPEIDYNMIYRAPISIPAPPELPAFKMPDLPFKVEEPPIVALTPKLPSAQKLFEFEPNFPAILPTFINRPVFPVMDIPAPHLMAEKPCDEPSLNEKGTPEIDHNLVKFEPISIPQPPELSDFVMPELPAIPTYFENKPIAYSPIQAEFKPLAILPAAPELPPAKLPEFPVSVEIPSGPILSPGDLSQPIMVVEQPNEEPCLKEETPNFDSEYKHVFPQPPELPPFDMPELSTLSFEQEPIKTYYEPLAPLPAAPELPAANLPEFPVNVEISAAPALPAIDIPSPTMAEEQPLPEIDYNMNYRAPISIPAPPELPAFKMPDLPFKVEEPPIVALTPKLPSAQKLFEFEPNFPAILPTFINRPCESSGKHEVEFDPYFHRYFNENVNESHNIMIPAKLMNVPCVYNLVMQHVLPNIASDHLKSLEKNKALHPTILPCA